MSAAPAASARPGRTQAQRIDGLLVIDMKRIRAHYECYRPGCPKPREEPTKTSRIRTFMAEIKASHLSQYHGENDR